MRRYLKYTLPLAALLLALPLAASAQNLTPAADQPTNVLQQYATATTQWLTVVQSAATRLFALLAMIEMSWLGVTLVLEGHDIQVWVAKLIKKVITLGFFLALLQNDSVWVPAIVNSFAQLGQNAGGTFSSGGMAPSQIMVQGFTICGHLIQGFGKNLTLIFTSIVGPGILVAALVLFCTICIFLAYLVITITFIMAKIEAFIVLTAGCIFLGFGGSRWTSSYVERYLSLAVATGVRLMVLYMLIGLGSTFGTMWDTTAQNAQFSLDGISALLGIAAGAFTFMAVCWSAPKMISGLLSGSISTGASELIAPAVGLAAGAATVAAAAATGGAALMGGAAALGGGSTAAGTLSGASSAASAVAPSTASGGPIAVGPPGFVGGAGVSGTTSTATEGTLSGYVEPPTGEFVQNTGSSGGSSADPGAGDEAKSPSSPAESAKAASANLTPAVATTDARTAAASSASDTSDAASTEVSTSTSEAVMNEENTTPLSAGTTETPINEVGTTPQPMEQVDAATASQNTNTQPISEGGPHPLTNIANTTRQARDEFQALANHLPQHDSSATAPHIKIDHGE